MDDQQQITQEPAQDPSPQQQPDTTQVTITAVSPLIALLFGSAIGVNIVAPLICWLIWKDQNPLVDRVGKNVLNAQISWTIYTIAALLSIMVFIGFVLAPVVIIAWLVLSIINAVKVANGEHEYVMPFTVSFLK